MNSLRKELPPVERGFPIPPLKYHPGSYPNAKRSRWYDYLLALEPGDSFVVNKPETQSIMLTAKRAGVKITWSVQPGGQQVRVWRVRPEDIPVKPLRKWVAGEKKQVAHPKGAPPAPVAAPEDSMMSLL